MQLRVGGALRVEVRPQAEYDESGGAFVRRGVGDGGEHVQEPAQCRRLRAEGEELFELVDHDGAARGWGLALGVVALLPQERGAQDRRGVLRSERHGLGHVVGRGSRDVRELRGQRRQRGGRRAEDRARPPRRARQPAVGDRGQQARPEQGGLARTGRCDQDLRPALARLPVQPVQQVGDEPAAPEVPVGLFGPERDQARVRAYVRPDGGHGPPGAAYTVHEVQVQVPLRDGDVLVSCGLIDPRLVRGAGVQVRAFGRVFLVRAFPGTGKGTHRSVMCWSRPAW